MTDNSNQLIIDPEEGFDYIIKQIDNILQEDSSPIKVVINFGSMHTPDEQSEILSKISEAKNLKSLRITGPLPIDHQGFDSVPKVKLKNILQDKGLESIAKILENNHGLEHIYLSCCGLTDENVGKIAESITKLDSLKEFISYGNPLGDNGVGAIVDALSTSDGLEELGLLSTTAKDNALIKLASCIDKWSNLSSIEVGISGGDAIDQSIAELSEAIAGSGNKKITNARLMGSHVVYPARVCGIDKEAFRSATDFATDNQALQRKVNNARLQDDTATNDKSHFVGKAEIAL